MQAIFFLIGSINSVSGLKCTLFFIVYLCVDVDRKKNGSKNVGGENDGKFLFTFYSNLLTRITKNEKKHCVLRKVRNSIEKGNIIIALGSFKESWEKSSVINQKKKTEEKCRELKHFQTIFTSQTCHLVWRLDGNYGKYTSSNSHNLHLWVWRMCSTCTHSGLVGRTTFIQKICHTHKMPNTLPCSGIFIIYFPGKRFFSSFSFI